MRAYRCFFVDSANHIFANDLIECETEIEVPACADRLLAARGCHSIEVWDCAPMIYSARMTDTVPLGRDRAATGEGAGGQLY